MEEDEPEAPPSPGMRLPPPQSPRASHPSSLAAISGRGGAFDHDLQNASVLGIYAGCLQISDVLQLNAA